MRAALLETLCVFTFIQIVFANLRIQQNYGSIGPYSGFGLGAFPPIQYFSQPHGKVSVTPLSTAINMMSTLRQNGLKSSQILNASERFSFDMTHAIAEAVQNFDANFVISPFSIWSLMVLIAEGASAESFMQLKNTLYLPNDLKEFRFGYKNIKRTLYTNTKTVELAMSQALFSEKNHPIDSKYSAILTNNYEVDLLPIDFRIQNNAAQTINHYVDTKTHGKIKHVVNPADLIDIQILLASSIFFRGQWKFPFDVNQTLEQPFYRENGEYIGHVPMMIQENQLRYVLIPALEASFIELPYGNENRYSMILIYPNSTLAAVFQHLRQFSVEDIHAQIQKNNDINDIDDVKLTLPRFKIDADLELSTVLKYLGVSDIFDAKKSNLSNMSKQKLHVTNVYHKCVVEVNEMGTIAAAVTTAPLSNRNIPKEFVFNRPFGFLITDQLTNTLLFAGQVRYPIV